MNETNIEAIAADLLANPGAYVNHKIGCGSFRRCYLIEGLVFKVWEGTSFAYREAFVTSQFNEYASYCYLVDETPDCVYLPPVELLWVDNEPVIVTEYVQSNSNKPDLGFDFTSWTHSVRLHDTCLCCGDNVFFEDGKFVPVDMGNYDGEGSIGYGNQLPNWRDIEAVMNRRYAV